MRTRIVAIAILLATVAACGPKLPPNTSPEAKIAIRGSQLIDGIRALLPQIKANTCVATTPAGTVCVDPKDAIAVVQHINRAADVAVDLSKVLEAIDNATVVDDKLTKTLRAKQLLADIQNLILQSTAAPLNPTSRQAIVGIMGSVTALLFSVF